MWYYCTADYSGKIKIGKVTKENLTITKEYRGFSICGKLYEETYNKFFNVHFDDFDKTLLFNLRDRSYEWVWISNSRKSLIEKAKDFFMDKQLKYDRCRREQEKIVEEESKQLKHYKETVRIFEKLYNKLEKLSIAD